MMLKTYNLMNVPIFPLSTAPGKTALDGGGRNSPYTSALLKHIDTPNITVIEMFQGVRSTVMEKSGYKQTPWESTSLRGNFYFATRGTDNRFSQEQARLEKERHEFEQMKLEFERKQRESKNQRIEVAGLPKKPSPTRPSATSNVIKRDGIYVAYANGIVRDTRTGLEWKVGPDRNMNWNEAWSWVQRLGDDWRMPTIDDLEGLYKVGMGSRNMTPLLKTTGWSVWFGETKGSSDVYFFNSHNSSKSWPDRDDQTPVSSHGRAFAVRSRSDG